MTNQIDITNEEIEFDEQLTKYMRGQLSQEEEQNFLDILNANPEKKAYAATIARFVKEIRIKGQTEDQLLAESLKKTPKNKTIKLVAKIAVAAAILTFIAIFGIQKYQIQKSQNIENQQIAMEYSQNISLISRGEDDEQIVNQLQTLFENVEKSENLDNTIEKIEQIWTKAKSGDSEYTYYVGSIGRMLVVAHLKNNNRKQAKIVLNQIIELNGADSANGQKAQEILNKLN